MEFSKRLKEFREEKKLSQRELAHKLGAEPSKYNKWESGKYRPDFETICKIAVFFNTTTDYLLGLSDVKYIETVTKDDMGKFLKLFFELYKSKVVSKIELNPNFYDIQKKFEFNFALFEEKKIDEEMLNLWCNARIKEYSGKSVSELLNKPTLLEQENEKTVKSLP